MSGTRKGADVFLFQLMLLLCAIWGLQQVAIKLAAPDVAPMLQVASLPAMSGYKYRAVLQALSTALAEGPYALAHTSKRIHELCLDAHVSVSRPDIHALLRALLFNGFDPTTSPTSFDDLVATGTQALRIVPRAEVPEDVMDPRLAVHAAREGVRQADEDLERVRDFWLR